MISAEKLHEYSSELCNDKSKSEVVLRSAARTAYYALYHKLLPLTIPQDNVKDGERNFGAHEALIRQLRVSDNQSHREWGLNLSRLKSVRNKADYKLTAVFTEHDAYTAMRKVGKLIKAIDGSERIEGCDADSEPDKLSYQSASSLAELNEVTNSAAQEIKVMRPTLKVIK